MQAPVFGAIAGVIGQSGLLLAPWSIRRGMLLKLLVLAALLPPLALLGHTLFEYVDFDGFVPQSPVLLPVALGAFLVHIWAFATIVRTMRRHAV